MEVRAMNRQRRFLSARCIAVLICTMALSGCTTTSALQQVSAPGDGKARVYFIRDNYPPYLREVRIVVDGVVSAKVANKDFVAVNIPTGSHSILIEASGGKPYSFEMPIDKPIDFYVVLTGDVKRAGWGMSYGQFTVYLRWNLQAYPVDRQEAESDVAGFGKRLN
jgi:hypothetical protein